MITDWRCAACHWVGHRKKLVHRTYEDFQEDLVCPECNSADVFVDDPVEWAEAAAINKRMKEEKR